MMKKSAGLRQNGRSVKSTGRKPSEAMKNTRDKILDTAERLFAVRGAEAVSLREINTAAGVSQGVLHYHFGGRDGVIEAVLERRLPAITAERRTMIEEIKTGPQPPTLRQLMSVIVRPLARVALEGGKPGQRFLKVMARLSLEHNKTFRQVVTRYFAQLGLETTELIAQQLDGLSREMVEYRLLMSSYSMYNTLAELEQTHTYWREEPMPISLTPEQRVEALLDFFCYGLQVPAPDKKPQRR